jgi:anaerobic selenocysteine-containing dehydrogenase
MAGNMPVPYITYTDPVLEPPPGVRPEWWIWIQLADAAGATLFGNRLVHRALVWNARASRGPGLRRLAITPDKMISGMLKKAGLPTRGACAATIRTGCCSRRTGPAASSAPSAC